MEELISRNNIAFDYYYKFKTKDTDIPISDRFLLKFKPTTRNVESFKQEVVRTAKYIRDNTDKKIMIAMSGGIDSEVVARGFIEAKIPFECLIVDNSYNQYDIDYAKKFCDTRNIKYTINKINLQDFILTGYYKYIKQGFRAHGVWRYMQLHIIDTIDSMGYCGVMGAGPLADNKIKWDRPDPYWVTGPEHINVLEFQSQHNTTHFPYFFTTTPELVASYLKEPLLKFCQSNSQYFRTGNSKSPSMEKILIYHMYYHDLERRVKYDGYEQMYDLRAKRKVEMITMFPEISDIQIPLRQIKTELGMV